jgi:hypothetical protein
MKNIQTHHLSLFLLIYLTSPLVFASSETENIWLYVFLIPVYFVLGAQALLVLLATVMKQFKTKQLVLLSVIIASILMIVGLSLTYYHDTMEKLQEVLLHFSVLGVIVFIFPIIQFKLLSKSENSPDET